MGIEVKNTPTASSSAVAELTIGHMFSLSRNIYISNVTMRKGEWNKKAYKGIELNGKTLGIIGFGRIGQEVAKRAYALGMKVLYNNRSGAKKGFENYSYATKDELLKNSDFITLHVPFIKENGPVLDTEEFNKMKDGVMIINAARGGVVNEKALLKALDAGKVSAAAIDVFEEEPLASEEIMNHDKISLTPHIGASTKEAQDRIGEEIFDKVKKHFENKEEVYVHC
jgi:D-3-phosphoglycerate dehydrogenase